jgi:hypothetical protein
MRLRTHVPSARFLPFVAVLSLHQSLLPAAGVQGQDPDLCEFIDPLPINSDDYDQPAWAKIIELAFPPWTVPSTTNANMNGCPRLDKVGGSLVEGYSFPTPEAGKFNPCYFTKAFAGLDPMLGGYPTPIDTKYPYEFAAPFFKQPGDGSTHHCPIDAAPETKIQSCPKVAPKCDGDKKDCNTVTDEFGIGHVPPFVPLAAIKNAYLDCKEDFCDWFNDDVQPCNIPKTILDRLIYDTFGVNNTVQFTPPKLLDDLPATHPKSTYYKLEYLDDPAACADDNCRGPHYCSKAVAEEDVWGDFCPYIHTGENSGLYRHPHIALAAVELWIANKCKPEKCPSTWLDSPNGKDYGDKMKSTSITWADMDDNKDPMAQPTVPYKWPNSGEGIFPGHELYGNLKMKPAAGSYVTKFVAMDTSGVAPRVSFMGLLGSVILAGATISFSLL